MITEVVKLQRSGRNVKRERNSVRCWVEWEFKYRRGESLRCEHRKEAGATGGGRSDWITPAGRL